jgi:hypothetical protein
MGSVLFIHDLNLKVPSNRIKYNYHPKICKDRPEKGDTMRIYLIYVIAGSKKEVRRANKMGL